MKALALILCLGTVSTTALGEEMSDTHKRQRALRHEENRKWELAKDACQARFPNGFKASHPDYDGRFKCLEEIQDAKQAFENKMKAEICERYQVSCKRAPASTNE